MGLRMKRLLVCVGSLVVATVIVPSASAADPTFVGEVGIQAYPGGLAVVGRRIYVGASRMTGLDIADLDASGSPTRLGGVSSTNQGT